MKKLHLYFFNKSILTQMRIILILAFLFFIMLSTVINLALQNVLQKNAIDFNKTTFNKIKTELVYDYNIIDSLYQQIQNKSEIKSLLMLPYAEKSHYLKSSMESLTLFKILNPNILDIALVSDDIHYSYIYSNKKLDMLWNQINTKKSIWLGLDSSDFTNNKENVLMKDMFIYGGNIYYNGKVIGAVIISFSKDSLYNQLSSTSKTQLHYLLAPHMDKPHAINCDDQIASDIFTAFQYLNIKPSINNSGIDKSNINGHKYILQYDYIPEMGSFLLSALDLDQTLKDYANIRPLILGCLMLIIFFIIAIFFLVNYTLVLPLRKFYHMLHTIRENPKGNNLQSIQLDGCIEIVSIGNEFSDMMKNINDLNKRIFATSTSLYETKLQKQEAEISYLRSQIDPHFLYNTLEVLRKIAIGKNAPELAEIALDIGKIFRYNTKGSAMATLQEEIGVVKSYLRIQQTRFQGKIAVIYSLSEGSEKIMIMKMLLQPIIENAIFHGLEPRNANGTLMISSKIIDANLTISIRDDGIGISEEKLKEINEQLHSNIFDTSKHIGIINTHARIRLQYGPPYGLGISSLPNDGTIITIHLPINESENRKESN